MAWHKHRKRELQAGLQHYPSLSMVSHYTKVPSEIPSAWAMGGCQVHYQRSVIVDTSSLLNTPYLAQWEDLHHFGATTLETLLWLSPQKFAMVSQLNHICYSYLESNCPVPQPTHKMEYVCMWQSMGCREGGMRKLSLTSESSPLLHHQTNITTSQHVTASTRSTKRKYEQRILNIEHASLSPKVLSCTGGVGRIASSTYKHLASLLAEKWGQVSAYGPTMCWFCCRLSFSLLRSSIQALCGLRSSCSWKSHLAGSTLWLCCVESQLTPWKI